MRDKIYDSADAACRAAATAWSSVYELAVQGNDKNIWVVEDAVWASYVHSCNVRSAAIEHQQNLLAGYRHNGRQAAVSRMPGPAVAPPSSVAPPVQQTATTDRAPDPVLDPAAVAAVVTASVDETQAVPAVPAPAPGPPGAAPLSKPQSAWERAEAAAMAADQGVYGAQS